MTDLPPWEAVYQQTQRWLATGCFEAIVEGVQEAETAIAAERCTTIPA